MAISAMAAKGISMWPNVRLWDVFWDEATGWVDRSKLGIVGAVVVIVYIYTRTVVL